MSTETTPKPHTTDPTAASGRSPRTDIYALREQMKAARAVGTSVDPERCLVSVERRDLCALLDLADEARAVASRSDPSAGQRLVRRVEQMDFDAPVDGLRWVASNDEWTLYAAPVDAQTARAPSGVVSMLRAYVAHTLAGARSAKCAEWVGDVLAGAAADPLTVSVDRGRPRVLWRDLIRRCEDRYADPSGSEIQRPVRELVTAEALYEVEWALVLAAGCAWLGIPAELVAIAARSSFGVNYCTLGVYLAGAKADERGLFLGPNDEKYKSTIAARLHMRVKYDPSVAAWPAAGDASVPSYRIPSVGAT